MAQPSTQASLTHVASGVVTFAERQQEKFPLNTFFSLQTFRLYYGAVDFIGGLLEYPLAIVQQYVLSYVDPWATPCPARTAKSKLSSTAPATETSTPTSSDHDHINNQSINKLNYSQTHPYSHNHNYNHSHNHNQYHNYNHNHKQYHN